jgi:ribosome maturation factor RimP
MHQDGLRKLIEPVVAALGYELVGVEFQAHARSGVLRIYIDKEEGITLEDCQRVSYQVSGLLDVEDPLPGRYSLEVSSPGLDRPLFTPEHFERFAGRRVRIRLRALLDGRRKFTGVLKGLRDGEVLVEEDGQDFSVPLDRIEQARLVPEI